MAYSAQSDIETVYGVQNIAEWSNLANDGSGVDTARIAVAIAYADEYIDNRFRNGPYAIPFTGTLPRVVVDWSARVAGAWLYRSRPSSVAAQDRMASILNGIENEMDSFMMGGRNLSATRVTGPTVPVALVAGDRIGTVVMG